MSSKGTPVDREAAIEAAGKDYIAALRYAEELVIKIAREAQQDPEQQRDPESDPEVKAARVRAQDACKVLVERVARELSIQVRAIIGRHHNADWEEVVQEVFLKVTRGQASFNMEAKFVPWFRTIAKNEAVSAGRRVSRHSKTFLRMMEDAEDVFGDPKDDDRTWQVRSILESLDPKQRKALEMNLIDGHSIEEIAQQIGSPRSTVGDLISRARRRFVAAWRGTS